MSNPFRYFFHDVEKKEITNGREINQEFLKSYNLQDSLADIQTEPDDCHVMQYDNGCLLTTHPAGQRVANVSPNLHTLDRKEFDWDGTTEMSLMWERDSTVDFLDQLRSADVPGYMLTIEGFKSPLHVPVAKSHVPANVTLPQTFIFNPLSAGYDDYEAVVSAKHRGLWKLGTEVFNAMTGSRDPLTEQRKIEIAIRVILANYRIGKFELAAFADLGKNVLTSETVQRILNCLVDAPNFPMPDLEDEEPTNDQDELDSQKKTSTTSSS